MLDEPYDGHTPVIREEIARIVVDIRDLGITTIIVEQDAMAVLQYSDRAVIFDSGGIAFRALLLKFGTTINFVSNTLQSKVLFVY